MLSSHIIDRYLLREGAKTWVGVASILLILTLGVGFARFITRAAAGELPAEVVFRVAAFSAIENLEIVLPVSLLLAIMLTIGRLCQDNEMTALTASGVGLLRLYRPFLLFSALLAALAAWLSLAVGPAAERSMNQLRGQAGQVAQLQAFNPGRFHTLMDGKAVFYAASLDERTGRMRDVFIRVATEPAATGGAPRQTVVLADSAAQRSDPETDEQTLVLHDGYRYEGTAGRGDYRVIHFAEHGVRIKPPTLDRQELDLSAAHSTSLLLRDDPAALVELQQRLSVPITVFVLALLALPLGYLPPRSGRYGRIVLGILVFLGYLNLLHLAEIWVVQGLLPPALGLWWVHGLVLLLAGYLIGRRQGRFGAMPGKRGRA